MKGGGREGDREGENGRNEEAGRVRQRAEREGASCGLLGSTSDVSNQSKGFPPGIPSHANSLDGLLVQMRVCDEASGRKDVWGRRG